MLRHVYRITGSAPLGQGLNLLESLPHEVLQASGIGGFSTLEPPHIPNDMLLHVTKIFFCVILLTFQLKM
jgi:hypothetical protein